MPGADTADDHWLSRALLVSLLAGCASIVTTVATCVLSGLTLQSALLRSLFGGLVVAIATVASARVLLAKPTHPKPSAEGASIGLDVWREARLGAMTTTMSRLGHDLRGMLSPAMLVGERMEMSDEPSTRRGGQIVIRAIERASEAMREAVAYAREAPMGDRASCDIAALVSDAARRARSLHRELTVETNVASMDCRVDARLTVAALTTLFTRAAAAGARRARLGAAWSNGVLSLECTDDGPPLSESTIESLFRPGPADPGMAVARDVARAHGGDLVLLETGATGTRFVLSLPAKRSKMALPLVDDGVEGGVAHGR